MIMYPYLRKWSGTPKGIKCGYKWHFPTYTNGGFAHELDFGKFSIMLNHRHIN